MKYLFFWICCFPVLCVYGQLSTDIRLNQVGFFAKGPKIAAVVGSSATTFNIKSSDLVITHFTGNLSGASTWASSGESVKTADFSNFTTPGNYVIEVPSLGYSYPFQIGNDQLVEVNRALAKAYYFNRCSAELPPAFAGIWSRNLGHPDTEVIILPSAASSARPAGTKISSPKGWYDAGDYNLYIASSGISVYMLCTAYEHYSDYYDTLKLNIPESTNNLPDILDQAKWNTDWMLTMQDPNDGGVYFKKTDAVFNGYEMPEADKMTRYMCKKSTSSAFNFAASMAVAYRVFKSFDGAYATQCLDAAKAAYAWGVANPNIVFSNPVAEGGYPAITTGDYVDTDLSDEYEWAANELYIATQDDAYYSKGFKSGNSYTLPNWNVTRTLGLISLSYHRKNLTATGFADTTSVKSKITNLATTYSNYQKNTSPYKIVMGQDGNSYFDWGSNGFAARQSFILLNAYELTKNLDFLEAALSNVDYLLGRNALGYCFVTGMGDKSPMNIAHRQSAADGIVNPVPGWMVGGPSNVTYISDGCSNYANTPATSYFDQNGCFTKNEVDINWNSGAVYATGAAQHYQTFNQPIPLSVEFDSKGLNSLMKAYSYPNPSSGETHVVTPYKITGLCSVQVIDMRGIMVKESVHEMSYSNNITLELTDIPKGVYNLQIITERQISNCIHFKE